MIAYTVCGAAFVGAITLSAFWLCATWARGRFVSYRVVKWAYRLFVFQWIAVAVAPLCYTAGDIILNSEWAEYVYSYSTLVFWAALAIGAALLNSSLMAYALLGVYRSQSRGMPQSRTEPQQFLMEEPCRKVFCVALLTYLLLVPEVYFVIFVTLFTGCASCMWE